jgi:hypothetical protein
MYLVLTARVSIRGGEVKRFGFVSCLFVQMLCSFLMYTTFLGRTVRIYVL